MNRPIWIIADRLGFALVMVGTVIFLVVHTSATNPDLALANCFGFFTIQSNRFACWFRRRPAAGQGHPARSGIL